MSVRESIENGFTRVHRVLYDASGGRVGSRVAGMPTLMLRTTGRQSGEPRACVLVYFRDGGDYVLVASNNGRDRPPAWYLNALADPQVELQVGEERIPANARTVKPGDDGFDRLWKMINEGSRSRFDGYQSKTDRPIPLLVLSPA